MFGRCKHRWVDVGKDYVPPSFVKNFEGTGVIGETFMDRVTLGTTLLSQRCSICNEPTTRELLGKFVDETPLPPHDLVAAAREVVAGDPQWWESHPLGVALAKIDSGNPGSRGETA